MKDINDILSQFDDLQSLPVSEEILGMQIEGNLAPLEELEINRLCGSNPLAGEIVSHSRLEIAGGQSGFIDDVELSALDDISFELPEIPDVGGVDLNEGLPGGMPAEETAAFEHAIPASEEEEYTGPAPLHDYGEAGPDDPDYPFTEDFLQSE